MKNEIYKLIISDDELRYKISGILKIKNATTIMHCRNKSRLLENYKIIKLIMNEKNLKENEIFD